MNKFLFFVLFLLPLLASCLDKKVHIVYFGEHTGDKALHEIEETHHSYLYQVKDTEEEARASLLYSYKNINGFAALLTPDEASKLHGLEEVVSVFESKPGKYSLQTTRSWEFVGLDEEDTTISDLKFSMGKDLLSKSGYGKNVVIGVLDSGVWPESESFSDEGMGPVPKSWKGVCQSGFGFNSSHCNKKIIGARYYIKGYKNYYGKLNASEDSLSPRDMDGHGSHTASTAAGSRVKGAEALGQFARGTASGGAPKAHLAIYKACWAVPGKEKAGGNTCFEEDMLAAIDDAIGDGVHVLSMSIGSNKPINYSDDGIAIGALHAAKNNIVVACAAGNSGPGPSTLSNPAPWIITVGASTLDRAFVNLLTLGDRSVIEGQTVTPYLLSGAHPLVYAGDVARPDVPKNTSDQCMPHSLSEEKVKGKIVLCIRGLGTRVEKGMEVKRAGGVGYILGNGPANGNEVPADAHVLPATAVTATDAKKILDYIKSNRANVTSALISPARTLYRREAPVMAAFTSRGPNVIDPTILKPDITAPGVNILAAWSGASAPTKLSADKRIVRYNIESGTSMACPHVAAAAALLRAIHPKWSSAAIRSALITTAWGKNNRGKWIEDSSGNLSNPFQYGSGHFRPAKAADPGLVYDATHRDYLVYLCSYGYKHVDPTFKCPKVLPPTYDLNYPSIAIPKLNGTVTIKRTLTNVGSKRSVYLFRSKAPMGFSVKASPSVLFFDRVGQKRSFTITVKATNFAAAKKYYKDDYGFGWFTWADNSHYVRSPIAVSLA